MSKLKWKYFIKSPNWLVEIKDFFFTVGEAFEGTHNYMSKKRPRYKYWKR